MKYNMLRDKALCGIITEQKKWAPLIKKILGVFPTVEDVIHETYLYGKPCYVAFGTTSPFT